MTVMSILTRYMLEIERGRIESGKLDLVEPLMTGK